MYITIRLLQLWIHDARALQLHEHADNITSSVLNMPGSSAKAVCVCNKQAAASKLAPMQLACCFACEIIDFETRSAFMLIGAVKQLHGSALSSNAATTAQSNDMMLLCTFCLAKKKTLAPACNGSEQFRARMR
jgi:hypothetical protein